MPINNGKVFPLQDKVYHAALVTSASSEGVEAFEWLVGKCIAWAYFSNVWLNEQRSNLPEGCPPDAGIYFPKAQVEDIQCNTCNPAYAFIRMEPRSRREGWREQADPIYTMEAIAGGQFDEALKAWANAAKANERPLLVEFGPEMNGEWFPWNGKHNGNDAPTGETAIDGRPRFLGQKRFRDAYIHIIELFNQQGVNNITWFFHVNYNNNPEEEWNRMAGYYPGDDYIDWIGLSCYGAYKIGPLMPLKVILDPALVEIRSFTQKPIGIVELGAIDHPHTSKAEWIENALTLIKEENDPGGVPYRNHIKVISWWHENWWEDDDLYNNAIDSSPKALVAYRTAIADEFFEAYLW